MGRRIAAGAVAAVAVLLPPSEPTARPTEPARMTIEPTEVDRVRDIDDDPSILFKTLEDTVWIADWSFDIIGGGCTDQGWVKYDNRILNDGSNYWSVNTRFNGVGPIIGNAAVLAKHDLPWVRDGYGNNWDYSIILKYQGASTLTFDYLSDSEPGFDFVTVEADSAGASESLVDYSVNPIATPEEFRLMLFSVDGVQTGVVGPLSLPTFHVPATIHEVYIRFESDGAYSDEDGLYRTAWNAGLVVDGITVTGDLAYSVNFEGALDPKVSLVNTAPATPFGEWARLYQHITDNEKCAEDPTCAWLWTDPDRPAYTSQMAFGPGGAVIRNWLDDVIVSPWVSLAPTPGMVGTVLSYRRFPGNNFAVGRIVQNWSVRARARIDNTDTSTPGDSIEAITPWEHTYRWSSLSYFTWQTAVGDMTPWFDLTALEIQVRFRVTDWNYIAACDGCLGLDTGPGPYVDRVRIGRRILTGPVFDVGIDTRSQAQDCFATERNSILPGEHYSPSTSRFGTCALSTGEDLGSGTSPNLITGDSIWVRDVRDMRGAGGIASVRWYGAIVRGPHAGKAPAPYTVGANGFFEVTPDSARSASGAVVAGGFFVDLDDTYFRGDDRLQYFWTATDALGGRASAPIGIDPSSFPPASVQAAERAVDGLYEASFLPAVNWAPAYLARMAADAHGDLDPTPEELAASVQRNCILYSNQSNFDRRSGDTHTTNFMWALDKLGYRTYYDVYDVQGYGNTNNQLGGRATVAQCTGYAIIIQDTGRGSTLNLPDGSDIGSQKIDQARWYRDYLAQGLASDLRIANLWLIGENVASEKPSNPLLATDCGLASVVDDQGLDVNPNVAGVRSFTFTNGNVVNFAGDAFSLNGGCPSIRAYDAAQPAGTAVMTHRYTYLWRTGPGAVILNKNEALHWNTIWMGFSWIDVNVGFGQSPSSGTGGPARRLIRKLLNVALPVSCVRSEGPIDVADPETEAVPAVTTLHPNVPNPFNPTTTIQFDLARDGLVRLQVFDVGGRLVKTLLNEPMTRGFGKSITWSGLDDAGHRVPSGVYFCKLTTDDARATRKMVALQ